MWGATEAGLFRYQGGVWTYFTRADGLPSDQANALAFASDGTLYVGTQCDGIAIASPADNYQTWRVIPGHIQMPPAATGLGLPSHLINCLLVTDSGTVYAGTPTGLTESRDAGMTWSYRRGEDWKDKLAGLYPPVKPLVQPIAGDLLREDYVTSLAEDSAGHLLIGHRQQGLEIVDLHNQKRLFPGPKDKTPTDYVMALLSSQDGTALIGGYGGGLLQTPLPAAPVKATPPPIDPVVSSEIASPLPAFPLPAKPPTLAELNAMLLRVQSLKDSISVGGASYLGEDWQTQGDWVGRYGSRYAVLCACGAPLNNYVLSDFSYKASGFIGPHHNSRDGLRTYCTWVHTDDPRVLWDPIPGYRREAEWDDHGEDYPQSYEGPDVWAKVTVPAGMHRLSLYLMNKDGHEGSNRFRDYLVEIKAEPADMPKDKWISVAEAANPDMMPTVARARVLNFWFGVYEQFLVRGPSVYMVKVAKNGSFNTILQTVLLDKLTGPPTDWETHRSVWYGKDTYKPPSVTKIKMASASVALAQSLWDALNQSTDKAGSAEVLSAYHLLAYRAVVGETNKTGEKSAAQDMRDLLANWRWHLSLWNSAQRKEFLEAMRGAWEGLAETNPALKLGNQ